MKELAKNYDPKSFEDRIYSEWEEGGYFHAEIDENKEPFTIVIPPPNITGQLHMGHALDQSIQDVLTRWRRLQGYSALWLPGSDHASIATEVKVAEEVLRTEGRTKDELGREEFLKRAWDWKELYGGKITEQQRRLGTSCDWQRERFTMDEGCNRAVVEFFVRLYEEGYIYKGERLINWCPDCGTSLSDAEAPHEDQDGLHWHFRYPGADGGEGIVVATSRPETMFGDTAIAVHPDDLRYKAMIGKKVLLPIVGRELPVIADPYPDPEKGTGAVKITPAHDFNDFEVGQRHNLPRITVIGEDAKMTAEAGEYAGLDRYDCRKKWVAALDAAGFLVKTEKVVISSGRCYRCDSVVEPLLSEQWFVKMEELAKPALKAAQSGELLIVPERFNKIYAHWLENIKDWCVSRQLWWGHRIPAWYCPKCGKMTVATEAPKTCPDCGSGDLTQDEDVLDTWFSSGLWPFSTLGWPGDTPDLKYFYPTSVLVTGYDIIFFWVIRMVFSGIHVMGEIPFKHVLIHGLVRDAQGRKMSKSLNNGVDPLDVIDRFGADALRFMLINGSSLDSDIRFTEDKLEAARNFANKLWNASRFVLMNCGDMENNRNQIPTDESRLKPEDRWILSKINSAVREITKNMEKFELSLAVQKVNELIWNEYCDWYIEFVKTRLYGEDEAEKETARRVLTTALAELLRLLHPFMPFITEEIWGYLGRGGKLITDNWPVFDPAMEEAWADETAGVELVMSVIRAIRTIRTEAEAPPSKKLTVIAVADDHVKAETIKKLSGHIKKLANVTDVYVMDTTLQEREAIPGEAATAIADGVEIYVPLEDLIDFEAERERLAKEKARLEAEIKRLSAGLSNEKFLAKAPAPVIESERKKLEAAEDEYKKLTAREDSMGGKAH